MAGSVSTNVDSPNNLTGELAILACPNAFKGSLTALEAAHAICCGSEVAREHGARVTCRMLPLADGGDGTLDVLVAASHGEVRYCRVTGPLGEPVEARWGRLAGRLAGTAVIESAEAAGLRLLQPNQYQPLLTTTRGVGELMLDALEAGSRRLVVGIGGTATNDGGAGMLQALGVHLRDGQGSELVAGGAALAQLDSIDTSSIRLPSRVEVVVASDVTNPLCGPDGASAVYGPQKGATPAMVAQLDSALIRFASIAEAALGIPIAARPGAGAAGGMGAALMAFCHAKLQCGSDLVLQLAGFDEAARTSQVLISGEGRLDAQTAQGKLISVIARRAAELRLPLYALCGTVEAEAAAQLHEIGVTDAVALAGPATSTEEAMESAGPLLTAAAAALIRRLASPQSTSRPAGA
ncbi:MAG: glycerate kinase [Armatimonadetes bacterium]|nr:glycerate kinase [Armatimonadota bacterium]MDE2205957.1 glycerate kinase [Armatimonadota bacterium]